MATYKEIVNPPLTWMLFIYFMFISMVFAVWAAFDFFQASVTFIVLTAALPYLWLKMRMVISVDTELHVDKAHIELKYLKAAQAVDPDQYRKLRTVNSDARSFHATRPWLKSGVQVFVNDERDPTTYWLIGSKKSAELIKNLNN
jgi:hypothetical protein